ncbi:F-box only protein 46 [Dunckerocampus dactyliophorus]|uniref:F-box only protein 46 n=1 Tax=Dunckerocampus dactyliophorus TaxID=161453 RepID=UPI0024075711|nr:F-box only protein 46 [Dunckerocampus dactyliophorus]
MDRDTFSHIRLWCPRPFGTYSQNKVRSPGTGSNVIAVNGAGSSSLCKGDPPTGARRAGDGAEDGGILVGVQEDNVEVEDVGSENTPPEPELNSSTLTQSQTPMPTSTPSSLPSSGSQMEDGRVLLDTWYVIKPGNTKEKIAFFVAHQFSGAGQPRPSAMKVKGNWATDCSKAKRRRRCSSYDPPNRAHGSEIHLSHGSSEAPNIPPSPDQPALDGANETDLLSVAQMVALVEQRTAMALRDIVAVHGTHQQQPSITSHEQGLTTHQHTLLEGTESDPTPLRFVSDSSKSQPSKEAKQSSAPIQTDQELEEQQESCRVAQAIAHFESQNLENRLHIGAGSGMGFSNRERELRGGPEPSIVTPPPPPNHSHGEVRIAFRVSNLDPRSQLEPAGRSRCMFMSCGGGSNQSAARSKEKITCDLYQLVSPSSRDPSSLLLAATAAPKADGDLRHPDRQACGSPETTQEPSSGEKKTVGVGRERVTGFHVEVVVTGAVDQCVFYGKDSTENVQEETVCFAMPGGGGSVGSVASSTDHSSDDPPPGQLFFFPPPRGAEEEAKATGSGRGSGLCSLDCAHSSNSSQGAGVVVGSGERAPRPDSPLASVGEECSDPSLCRLYRHVSHDFLEIRFQIQRLLEPRQYMLLLPDHIMVNIFSYLPTRSLAALKCTCHYFKVLIETYGVRAVDSRWNQDPLYRDDPCKQCKRHYERGDVSLCRWHPKPYHHDLPYGRSYWMCCRRTDKDTPGCRVGLHDNNWVQQPADGSQPIRSKREERQEEAR